MAKKDPQKKIAIKEFVEKFFSENGYSPTVREIEKGVGITRATVQRYLEDMREDGELNYSGRRGITTIVTDKMNNDTVAVPLVGQIACGAPILAQENIEEYYRMPVVFVGEGDFFMLKAKGDSMIEAGIDDGDTVLIRKQNVAREGQIVVALMDDEATLKRYYKIPGKKEYRLHPENKKYEDIIVSDLVIQGIAVKVFKDLS